MSTTIKIHNEEDSVVAFSDLFDALENIFRLSKIGIYIDIVFYEDKGDKGYKGDKIPTWNMWYDL